MKFSIKDFFLQEIADLVTFTEEILNEKLHFLCRGSQFRLTHFWPLFIFHIPWKHQKTFKNWKNWNIDQKWIKNTQANTCLKSTRRPWNDPYGCSSSAYICLTNNNTYIMLNTFIHNLAVFTQSSSFVWSFFNIRYESVCIFIRLSCSYVIIQVTAEVCSEPWVTYKMELFEKMVNVWKLLTMLQKASSWMFVRVLKTPLNRFQFLFASSK